jgi:hypothetical protein
VVVVQAVAGSSPVAHPHEVAAHSVFLRQRHFDSARGELPMSYQFFGGTGEFELVRRLGLHVGERRAASGTRSESGCRCRSVRVGRRASRRVISSRSWAHSAHQPSSRAGCDHAPAPARAPGPPLGVLVAVETLPRRDIPQHSFASGIRPSTIDHEAAGPAAPHRASEVAAHVRELLRAEHNALHPAWPHALRCARVSRSSPSWRPEETGENKGSDDPCMPGLLASLMHWLVVPAQRATRRWGKNAETPRASPWPTSHRNRPQRALRRGRRECRNHGKAGVWAQQGPGSRSS